MRKLKTILVAFVMVASLYAAAGTAWARSDELQRGTSWTDAGDVTGSDADLGISWELFSFAF
ncbi:MAG: hypothetical protein E6I54_02730 [Chloroflexi bacterium]|nr:MAG: hypothetical protein E6I54_02730 [Chloroflexota bacterium]TMF64574.1 MAG: hypothetical protein E6I14_03250 [Chloroflexota bacterium]